MGKLTFIGRRQCRDAQVLLWGVWMVNRVLVPENKKVQVVLSLCFAMAHMRSRRGQGPFATLLSVTKSESRSSNAKLISYQRAAFVSFGCCPRSTPDGLKAGQQNEVNNNP